MNHRTTSWATRIASFVIATVSTFGLVWSATAAEAKKDDLPSIPGATLLLGHPPHSLALTTPEKATILQEERIDWYITPSMSSDGSVIASAHPVAGDPPAADHRMIVSTYSVADKKWTDYEELQIFSGSVAISFDGSKLACITKKVWNWPPQIKVLDLKTGKIAAAPEAANKVFTDLSWSPDGRRLAFNAIIEEFSPLEAIYILDLESGAVSKVAMGTAPSWSPSGEWIAFNTYAPTRRNQRNPGGYFLNANRVSLVRPDGSDSRVIAKFGRNEFLNVPPVWSPDSKMLLINNFRDDNNWAMDIYALDLATLKLTKKFKNVPPVHGWTEAK